MIFDCDCGYKVLPASNCFVENDATITHISDLFEDMGILDSLFYEGEVTYVSIKTCPNCEKKLDEIRITEDDVSYNFDPSSFAEALNKRSGLYYSIVDFFKEETPTDTDGFIVKKL